MPAQPVIVVVAPHHHGHGIPAHQRANAAFHEKIAGHHFFLCGGDRIGERSDGSGGQRQTAIHAMLGQLLQKKCGTLLAFLPDHIIECLEPLESFRWVAISLHRDKPPAALRNFRQP